MEKGQGSRRNGEKTWNNKSACISLFVLVAMKDQSMEKNRQLIESRREPSRPPPEYLYLTVSLYMYKLFLQSSQGRFVLMASDPWGHLRCLSCNWFHCCFRTTAAGYSAQKEADSKLPPLLHKWQGMNHNKETGQLFIKRGFPLEEANVIVNNNQLTGEVFSPSVTKKLFFKDLKQVNKYSCFRSFIFL